MFAGIRNLFSASAREAAIAQHMEELRKRLPAPVLWLLGKTQSGKTSLIRYLTGAESAQIGTGYQPCTRFTRRYPFPTAEAPLLTFLDTRGLEEPSYDPKEDLAAFDTEAHLVVVTVRALDHAQDGVVEPLRVIRKAQPQRPVLLVITCLHEAYPQQQHPEEMPEDLRRSMDEQKRRFEGLHDASVAVDLTPPEEGFQEPNYGGPALKQAILDLLPAAYRQTLISLDESTRELQDLYERLAEPHVLAYSMLAAATGAIPIPFVDLLILPGIQAKLMHQLANIYGQPLSAERFLELASSLGLGLMMRQAAREVTKLIPFVGSVASGALAGASTYALGKAFCFYYSAIHKGHVPSREDLKKYYQEQLHQAERFWGRGKKKEPAEAKGGPA